MTDAEYTAVAHWVEVDGDSRYLCFDTAAGDTITVDVTDIGSVPEIHS